MPTRTRSSAPRVLGYGLGAFALLFFVLAIPAPAPDLGDAPVRARRFVWSSDSLWRALETSFVQTRAGGCPAGAGVAARLAGLSLDLAAIDGTPLAPDAPVFDSLEAEYFALAPQVAACPEMIEPFVNLYGRMRETLKRQSAAWDVNALGARDRLYRALYGGRAAVEEVMLQQPSRTSALLTGSDVPSATPSAMSNGVALHSGDILVSRGGYPTSALIARGNDYPGNFSHIALVHVDSATRAISVIEAHIELGVAVTTADGYLADKKLRVMLLRPRADLPALQADPMLPHRAATAMLARARGGHIPYDFAMDYTDPSRLFCSEVASAAYRAAGLELWMGLSTISHTGLRDWLASFGVRHFATQEPSDLEYDPQLGVVAEWHDAGELFADHVDNAVTDAMLEGAERGERLGFPWYTLPVARALKGYSWVRERTGGVGTIPEGMSAEAALRNRGYGERHDALAAVVSAAAAEWQRANGYVPTYWTLVELARSAAARE